MLTITRNWHDVIHRHASGCSAVEATATVTVQGSEPVPRRDVQHARASHSRLAFTLSPFRNMRVLALIATRILKPVFALFEITGAIIPLWAPLFTCGHLALTSAVHGVRTLIGGHLNVALDALLDCCRNIGHVKPLIQVGPSPGAVSAAAGVFTSISVAVRCDAPMRSRGSSRRCRLCRRCCR